MPKSLLKKKSVSRKTLKLKSNNKSKSQNKYNSKSKSKYNSKSKSKYNSKSKSKKNKKKHSRNHKGGAAACEYLKVEEMKFDDLKIPEQYALLDSNCQQSGVPSATSHPNLST
jgi:hypothetical protein